MRRNLFVITVVAIVMMSSAGIANAQAWWNHPVGLSISLTSEASAPPWAVGVDITVQTLDNVFYGTYTHTTIGSVPIGSQFWRGPTSTIPTYWTAKFVDLETTGGDPVTTVNSYAFVFPGRRAALNWDDGSVVKNAMIPLLGDGTGAYRGSFSHTYADNYAKSIRAGASNSNLYAGEFNGIPAPLSGEFTDTVATTSIWATTVGDGSPGLWWFGGAGFGTAPMGIKATTFAWRDNPRDVVPIPTMSGIGMLVLAGLLAGLGVFVLTRR